MRKYGLTGTLRARKGKGKELAEILLQSAGNMNGVKGCETYIISIDPSDPDAVCVFEVWDSKEDHDNSLALTFVREAISKAMPLLDGKPEGRTLEVLGGLGVK